jgi:hypothetical protein
MPPGRRQILKVVYLANSIVAIPCQLTFFIEKHWLQGEEEHINLMNEMEDRLRIEQ